MPPEAVEIVFPPHVIAAIALIALALCVLLLLLAIPPERPQGGRPGVDKR